MQRLPGSLVLGLLSAFAAHAALYGGGHVMGGAWGGALQVTAAFSTAGFVAAWLALGWACGDRLGDGSIAFSKLSKVLPSASHVVLAAAGWFWLAESIEDGHADAPIVLLAIAVALSGTLVRMLAACAMRALTGIIFGARARAFRGQEPFGSLALPALLLQESVAHIRRRFARPPPVVAGA